jgi:hypothetical protein
MVIGTSALFLHHFEIPEHQLTRINKLDLSAAPGIGPYVACLAALMLLVLGMTELYRALRAQRRSDTPGASPSGQICGGLK